MKLYCMTCSKSYEAENYFNSDYGYNYNYKYSIVWLAISLALAKVDPGPC